MNILRLSTLSLTLAIVVFALGSANPSFAAPKSCEEHPRPSCNGDTGDDGDVAMYSVTIEWDVEGGSADDWRGDFGGKKTIGLNDAVQLTMVGKFTDLSFFDSVSAALFGDAGHAAICFPVDSDIHQGSVSQGRQGTAKAGFFFDGFTHTKVENDDGGFEFVPILYGLRLFNGSFTGQWLPDPSAELIIMDWELSVTNEGKAIKSISCIGKGQFTTGVKIVVTKIDP